MSKYQTLCEAYGRHRADLRRFFQERENFAGQVVQGLIAHLGIPNTYRAPDGASKRYIPYFEIDDSGNPNSVAILQDAISYRPDGSFDFGLGVVLESEPGVQGITTALLKLVCRWHGDQITVRIGASEVDVTVHGNDYLGIARVHETIVEQMMEWFSRPSEDSHQEQIKIGFRRNGPR